MSEDKKEVKEEKPLEVKQPEYKGDPEEKQQYDWMVAVVTGNEVNGGLRIKEYNKDTETPSDTPTNTIEFTATKKTTSSVLSMVDNDQEISLSIENGKMSADKLDLNTHKSEKIDNATAISMMSTVLKEHFDQPGNGDEDTIAADPLANPYDPEENPGITPSSIVSSGEDDQDDEGYDKQGDGDGSDPDDYRPDDGYTEEEEVDVKEDLEWDDDNN